MNKSKYDRVLALGLLIAYGVSLALPTVLVSGTPEIPGYYAVKMSLLGPKAIFDGEFPMLIPCIGVYANLNICFAISLLAFQWPKFRNAAQARRSRRVAVALATVAVAIAPWMFFDNNPPYLGYWIWIVVVLTSTRLLFLREIAKI